jgi:hypothetical protein
MANRWVEFVRKWAKDNNMNYMCAMTTKECKDAYLKAYPKPKPGGLKGLYDDPEGKYSIDVDGLLDLIGGLLGDLSNLGTDGWSGSNDNIIKLAKKHKVNISKFLSKEDAGWYQEYDTVENILDGFKGKNYSNKLHFFLQDLFELLEGYRNKGEQMGMAEADVPAPDTSSKKVKVPKKAKVIDTIYENGNVIWHLQEFMDDVVSLGAWSGSLDDIKAIAKKHKLGITKYLKKTELKTIESLISGLENDDKRENVYHFFVDLSQLLEDYKSKAEKKGKDAPAPPPAKKVIIKVPKKTKKAVMGETNTQPELVKMILDDMKKSGVKMDDTGDRTVVRKQKPDIKKVEDRLDAGEDIREELKGLVDLYDKELLGMKDSKKVEELVEKFNIKKRAEKAKKKE